MKLNKEINGKTKLYGLIGNPVSHSLSPIIQNTLSSTLCVDSKYLAFNVEKNKIKETMIGIESLNLCGINITYPLKEKCLEYADIVSDDCKILGCANTIHIDGGKKYAYSTDGIGFIKGFESKFNEKVEGKNILLLGFGGAGRAIALSLIKKNIKNLYVHNRTKSKVEEFIEKTNTKKIKIIEDVKNIDVDIIINSSTIGFEDNKIYPLIEEFYFNSNQYVVDIIYNPLETKMIRMAKEAGAKTQNGLGMLVFQAIESFSIWNNVKISGEIGLEIINKIEKEYLKNK